MTEREQERLLLASDKVIALRAERDRLVRLNRLFDMPGACIGMEGVGAALNQLIDSDRIKDAVLRKVRVVVIDAIGAVEKEIAALPMPETDERRSLA